MSTRLDPDCSLTDFDIEPNGDVFLHLSDDIENYYHALVLSAATVAGIAEASAAARKPPAEGGGKAMTEPDRRG